MPEDQEHPFIAFRDGKGWGGIAPLRYASDPWGDDDEAQISRDDRILYFTSNRPQPIHHLSNRGMLEDFARLE